MHVFQTTFTLYLHQDLPDYAALTTLGRFLDIVLCKTQEGIAFHTENKYKHYSFNSLHPTEHSKTYYRKKCYSWQVRTVSMELAELLSNQLIHTKYEYFDVVDAQLKILPKHSIKKLYSITPCIIKMEATDENGSPYWQNIITEEEYLKRIKVNLVKKYNQFSGTSLSEDFQFFDSVEVINRQPIACAYKGVKLLGDKLDLYISDNQTAQELAYFALGTGILEMNSRGYGFVNDKWSK